MKALVLSGGGCKGAFQLGVLKQLQELDPELDYDIYTGISVGALNSSLLATGPLKETLPKLEEVWMEDIKKSSSVRTHRMLAFMVILGICIAVHASVGFALLFFALPKWAAIMCLGVALVKLIALCAVPFIKGIPFNRSIYNTKPLRKLVKKRLDLNKLKTSGKKLRVGAVSYYDGKYKTANEQSDDIVKWIMASSAFPIFFPMEKIGDDLFLDGGVSETVPLQDAIDLGATDITVILASPLHNDKKRDDRLPSQVLRVIDLMTTEIINNDVFHDNDVHERGIKIKIIAPKEHFDVNPLDFEPKEIRMMYNSEFKVIKENFHG